MTKRVIDGDAMRASGKLAKCTTKIPASSAVYYPWFYTLSDSNGVVETTNTRVIWMEVAKILPFLKLPHVEAILEEYEREGLLFVWTENGKRFGYFTGSEVPGRLPPKSWRDRYDHAKTKVPKNELLTYTSRFTPDVIKAKTGWTQGNIKAGIGIGLGIGIGSGREKEGIGFRVGAPGSVVPRSRDLDTAQSAAAKPAAVPISPIPEKHKSQPPQTAPPDQPATDPWEDARKSISTIAKEKSL